MRSLAFFFFCSSRRRHTRWNCDWSSDVCSSDLIGEECVRHLWAPAGAGRHQLGDHAVALGDEHHLALLREADILAQLVLQDLEADGAHGRNVASGSYQRNEAPTTCSRRRLGMSSMRGPLAVRRGVGAWIRRAGRGLDLAEVRSRPDEPLPGPRRAGEPRPEDRGAVRRPGESEAFAEWHEVKLSGGTSSRKTQRRPAPECPGPPALRPAPAAVHANMLDRIANDKYYLANERSRIG